MVVIDKFSEFGRTVPLKNKNAQSIKDAFENIPISSKKRKRFEIDRGTEFYNINFQKFLNKNNFIRCSINTAFGAVFVENFNGKIRDLLKRPVSEKGDGNWFDFYPRKQNNIIIEYILPPN